MVAGTILQLSNTVTDLCELGSRLLLPYYPDFLHITVYMYCMLLPPFSAFAEKRVGDQRHCSIYVNNQLILNFLLIPTLITIEQYCRHNGCNNQSDHRQLRWSAL